MPVTEACAVAPHTNASAHPARRQDINETVWPTHMPTRWPACLHACCPHACLHACANFNSEATRAKV
eukprot:352279-Chlamydomonas_euryale.AAC.6